MSRLNWFDWLLIVWWAYNALATIGRVGKVSFGAKPLPNSVAIVIVIIDVALIFGLVLTR